MSIINAFVWVTPAFGGNIPGADHTWVTSYDSRKTKHPDIGTVQKTKDLYWFCKGSFHLMGKSKISTNGLALKCDLDKQSASCLVTPNDDKQSGTIKRYGIDGLCHQVTNQTISLSTTRFPQSLRSKVRGYRLSCVIYGLYGRRREEWYEKKRSCSIASRLVIPVHSHLMRSLSHFPQIYLIKDTLELTRKRLLNDIDIIGKSKRSLDETNEHRAEKLNDRIQQYLEESYAILEEGNIPGYNNLFLKIFGIKHDEKTHLIDPKLFVIPNDDEQTIQE